jgi:hypothetical protein
MRRVILISILFISYCASSQIKVLETKPLEKVGKIGSNDIYLQKEGNEYTVFYKNVEIKEVTAFRNFSFKDLDGDFEGLYKIIMDGFNASPLFDIKLELPNDYVWLHYTRSADKISMQFMSTNKVTSSTGISDFLNKAQVNKLFGKD